MPNKRLAYVDVTPELMAQMLGLPAGSEVVGVGWEYGGEGEPGLLLIQVRSEDVPPRAPADAGDDPDADDKAEHVVVKRGATGEFGGFEKVEDG